MTFFIIIIRPWRFSSSPDGRPFHDEHCTTLYTYVVQIKYDLYFFIVQISSHVFSSLAKHKHRNEIFLAGGKLFM